MLDQIFENYRKASESWMQMQQDMMKQMAQRWNPTAGGASGAAAGEPTEWNRAFQKRSLEMAVEALNKLRESLDSMFAAGVQVIEQTFRVSEAKSSEDYRRVVDDLWRKLFDTFKSQSETQLRDFQAWTEKSMAMAQNGQA
jgi:hypothetical protein